LKAFQPFLLVGYRQLSVPTISKNGFDFTLARAAELDDFCFGFYDSTLSAAISNGNKMDAKGMQMWLFSFYDL